MDKRILWRYEQNNFNGDMDKTIIAIWDETIVMAIWIKQF